MKAPTGYRTTPRERGSYWIYFVGQNMFYAIVNNYLVTYMMMIGIDIGMTATVMLAVKIWDAVNDALFGWIFDKVKFKKGKCLPWIRISSVVMPLATIFLFIIPSAAGQTLKLVWFTVAYLLWDFAYTLCDTPVYSMVTTMTDNVGERNKLMSVRQIFAGVGMGVTGILGTVLVSENVGMSFSAVSVVVAIGGFITMLPICFWGVERGNTGIEEETFTLREMFRYLRKNKYLLLFFCGVLLCNMLATSNGLGMFISYYLFGSSLFNLLLSAIAALPALILALFIPKILEKIDKYYFFIGCMVAQIVLGVIMFATGYQNMIVTIILITLRALPLSAATVTAFMFTPDCAEYGKFVSGTDAKGITFAIQSFTGKLASAIASSLSMIIIGWFGWISVNASSFAELEALGVTQPQQALDGLWFTYVLVPAIGQLLALIPLSFYKLRDKDVRIMIRCNFGEITREEAEQQLSKKY